MSYSCRNPINSNGFNNVQDDWMHDWISTRSQIWHKYMELHIQLYSLQFTTSMQILGKLKNISPEVTIYLTQESHSSLSRIRKLVQGGTESMIYVLF